jgi:hypothetical protein
MQAKAKSKAPKPNQRKKWRTSTVLLVSDPPPPPSSQPENTGVPQKPDNSSASEVDIPLKLPRAMRSAASNSGNLLRERNAGQSDAVDNKEPAAVLTPTSPLRQRKTEEKENNGH